MTTATPTNSGGAVTSWEISPSLPTGLSFGTTNGSIWGTPENVTSNATYTVYANNSGGSGTTTVALTMVWTLTPSVDGALIIRNSSIGTDITWEWDYDPLEAGNLTMYASWRNTCAIRDDGDLYCWGRNGNGQLGIGSMGSTSTWKDRPTKTNNLGSDAISVSMGEQHTCAVLDTGVLKCWGRNHHGQVGDGSTTDRSTPQTINVGSGRTTTSVYMGFHHTCAILDDQSVKCWGRNQNGELGVGSTTSSFDTPQTINTLGTNRHAISLALGEGFTCALLDDGSIKCWGQDNEGQRGDGGGYGIDIRSPPSSAISLPAGRTATQITAGAFHVCALLDDASVVCWGKNHEGQLGDGSTTNRTAPVTTGSFGSGHTPSYISAGYDHTCALLTDGGVRCWGSNNNGQLGDGTTTDSFAPPSSDINLGSGYTAIGISSGGGHTCAMLNDGDMKCWGASGSGQLGNNNGFNGGDEKTPVFIQGSRVWQEGDFLTSPDVSGATCGISPALPTGLSLTAGTCAITGTPTVTALNATYTIWANISGESFSGQVWLEVGLNVPIPSYSPNSYTFTNGSAITPITATNTGGEVVNWDFDSTFPSGLNLGAFNGTIWGTPDTVVSTTTYTIWANNSAGSASTTITFTVNDVPPSISYSASSLSLLKGAQMSALAVTNSGGAIVSCSVSPSLPNGMSLSSTCELSGTPTVAATNASYTITATNTGGSDSTSIYIEVLNSGGTLTVTPTHSTGSVNATLASIAASYSHSLTIPPWTSGVTNTSVEINNSASVAGTAIAAWDNGNLAIAWTRPIYGGTTQHVLALSFYDGSSWTTQDIDTASRTGYRPSIAIDNQGALHIAYLDRDNTNLRYATNASGSWVLSTLDSSSVNPNNDAAKTGIAIDNRGHVHIIHPVQGSGVWVLNYTTNVSAVLLVLP
jgi:alpha-tubulin suppressor-like RCC1 family protein